MQGDGEQGAEHPSSTLADDPQFQADRNDLTIKIAKGNEEVASSGRGAAFTSSNTEDSQASILEDPAPGNVVFEIDGKRVDLVVAKEEVDISLEPGERLSTRDTHSRIVISKYRTALSVNAYWVPLGTAAACEHRGKSGAIRVGEIAIWNQVVAPVRQHHSCNSVWRSLRRLL